MEIFIGHGRKDLIGCSEIDEKSFYFWFPFNPHDQTILAAVFWAI